MPESPITVGLLQINNSFSGQNYLPYSVACLESYARANLKQPERFRFLEPIYKRLPIHRIVEHLDGADVAGFSTYVWNANISLEAARRYKARRPDGLVVFGGPHVPDKSEDFLRRHPFIDLAVHNEGERTFVGLLESLDGGWRALPGISFIDADGRYVKTAPAPRFRELDQVPSPFLNGMFDQLMANHPEEQWIALWETNRGCPFQCTFCDWGSATAGKVSKFAMDRLSAELRWFARRGIEYVFVCDANFGIQKRDVEIAEQVAAIRRETGLPHGFSVQNTKNATERAYLTQKILSDAGLNKGVALSMQTLDPTTLANVKRDNISLDTYLELSHRFATDGVETYSDLILGLPGETYDSFADGVDRLIESGQHNRIQFNNLSILPNAEMADPEYIARFGIVTVESAIINIHGRREAFEDDVPEIQQLVVATASMPHADWRRTRCFGWMTAFLHFDKLLQLPLVVAHELTGVTYRHMIEAFLAADRERYPVIGALQALFEREAAEIQAGGAEFVYSEDWLGIYWPADEYAFIKLVVEGSIDRFYDEAHALLRDIIGAEADQLAGAVLADAIRLNGALVCKPGATTDLTLSLRHDVANFVEGVKKGRPRPLDTRAIAVTIRRGAHVFDSLERWCREVVWWGNKKGAYLYGGRALRVEPQLAGHF